MKIPKGYKVKPDPNHDSCAGCEFYYSMGNEQPCKWCIDHNHDEYIVTKEINEDE